MITMNGTVMAILVGTLMQLNHKITNDQYPHNDAFGIEDLEGDYENIYNNENNDSNEGNVSNNSGWGHNGDYNDINDDLENNQDNIWGMSVNGTSITINREENHLESRSNTVNQRVFRPWSHQRKTIHEDSDSEEEEIVSIKSYHKNTISKW